MLTRRQVVAGMAGTALCGMAGFGLTRDQETKPKVSDVVSSVAEPPSDAMTYRKNAKTGDAVSLLGFGCMRYPVMPGEKSPRSPNIDERAAFALVDYAIAHGVNYFDTAWGYHGGASETFTGKALRRHPRERFFLATKMPSYLDPTRAQAEEIFATQLKKCQVEYFDYYLLHTLTSVASYKKTYEQEGVLDFLLAQRKAGRIRNLGWSFHGDKEMLTYVLSRDVDWDFAMIQANYHDLRYKLVPRPTMKMRQPAPADWMLEKMAESKLPIILMEPLLGGRLARLNKKALSILQETHPTASAASWAFRFAGGLPNVLTVLSGMTEMAHLKDNIATYAPFVPLSEEEHRTLDRSLRAFLVADNIRCTTCGYCMPCPYGVDIPMVFRQHNNCVDDGLVPRPGAADEAHVRSVYLARMRAHVPALRTAAHCIGCGQCVSLCPQSIDIPAEMDKLRRVMDEERVV